MSDELTKLAKLANIAVGDYQPNSLTAAMSPQNFGKYHHGGGGPMIGRDGPLMGPLKEVDKAIGRVKQQGPGDMGPNYNCKLESIKEENSASYMNVNSLNNANNMNSVSSGDTKGGLQKDPGGLTKEENGGVFHENTDQQQDVKNLPVSEKLCSSPNWGPKQMDGHMGMNNRIDGSQFPHMPVQYPQHYPTGPSPTPQSHVFSTLLANQAAKAVYTGQTHSIITFHQSLTAKRKFLDPDQDIKLDAPMNQPPTGTPTPPQTDGNGTASAGNKHDTAETMKNNDTTATPSNGQKEESNGPASNKSVSNPKTPQSNSEQPPRPLTAPESAPATTTKKTGAAKRGKRKRSQSTTQPLHPTMPAVAGAPNMAMQQGMPPSGPSFAPFPRGSFVGGTYPPQSPQMRPGMPPGPQGGMGPSTTETENLDPSALWENPPSNKRRQMMSTMAPSWAQQQQEFAMAANQSIPPGPRGSMMPDGMMNQRAGPFMGRQGPHDQFPMAGGSPYDMAGFNPGQPMDSLTPEQMRHREESLRTLKEMQKMLFPEEHQPAASPAPGGMLSPHRPMPPDGPMMGPNSGMVSPSMMGPMMGPGHPMMAMRGMSPMEQQRFMMSQPSMAPPLPQDYESMTPQQKAWAKLQQEFYMDKQRKMIEEQAKMQHSHMMDFPGRGPPMRFGPGPFPQGGDPMVQTMPPPPPYHASASSMLQRRASMSGSFSPGGGPHGSFGPMSPHAMTAAQPAAARLARSNSLPSAQMPMGPVGAMPMQGSLSPESSQIRPHFRASTPTPASLTATGGSTAGMNPGSAGGPLSAPAMSSNSPGMSMGPQSCDTMVHTPGSMAVHSPHPIQPGTTSGMMSVNSPRPNHSVAMPGNMVVGSPHPSQPGTTPGSMVVNSPHPSQPVTTLGNMIVNSPHPNQPGTPVMDQGMSQAGGGPAGNMGQGTPNTPSPAVSIAKQAMGTSGNQRCSPKTTIEHTATKTTPVDNTPPPTVENRKSGGPSSVEMNVQQHQKLVNFPTSQLNRDKAPNFPPRGEDLQQYSTTFYQKTKEQPGGLGPSRMPPQFSSTPINRSPMNPDLMNASNGGNVMPSSDGLPQGMINNGPATTIAANRMAKAPQPSMMSSQPNVMTSQQNIMTSQPSMMSTQPSIMTSQQTPQASMMAQQSNMAMTRTTTQPRAIAPAQPMATTPQMTSGPNMTMQPGLTSQAHRMAANMATSQPNMNMTSQPNAMTSMQQNMMTSMQHNMMTAHSRMMSSPSQMSHQPGMMGGPTQGMMPGAMMSSGDRVMMSPQMMSSQVRGPISSNGPMMSHGMRMANPHGGMMDPAAAMMAGHQGRPMMTHQEMVMQQHKGHMMPSNMGPPMDGMVGGPMDMAPGGNSRFAKGPMMDGMMPEGMDQVMDHPMNRQMMAAGGMRQPQPTSPLTLLQTRFSPPLPPDGKVPTKTLQYFPPGTANVQVQGQGGNPHLNPAPNQQPGPAPGPKQIQMPFPMEMITSGPSSSPSLSQAMGPHRMQGMVGGGMGPRMMQSEMMYHHHGDFVPRGPSPVSYMGPRPGMSPYGPMQHVRTTRMPGGMAAMGPMQGGPYMDPGFGPQMMGGHHMGPGYNMPR